MRAAIPVLILAVLASSCKSSPFVYCPPAAFANCTVAKCAPKEGGDGYICDCFVDNRYSATAKASTCVQAKETGTEITLQSRYHPVDSYQLCTKAPSTTPLWAWCLGQPCRSTPNGTSAQCECTGIPSGVQPIPYIVVTPTYLTDACVANPAGIVWSSATPGDVSQITAFLQKQPGLANLAPPVVIPDPVQP